MLFQFKNPFYSSSYSVSRLILFRFRSVHLRKNHFDVVLSYSRARKNNPFSFCFSFSFTKITLTSTSFLQLHCILTSGSRDHTPNRERVMLSFVVQSNLVLHVAKRLSIALMFLVNFLAIQYSIIGFFSLHWKCDWHGGWSYWSVPLAPRCRLQPLQFWYKLWRQARYMFFYIHHPVQNKNKKV